MWMSWVYCLSRQDEVLVLSGQFFSIQSTLSTNWAGDDKRAAGSKI